MNFNNSKHRRYARMLEYPPHAMARVYGTPAKPSINGTVCFFQTSEGILVATELYGLPWTQQPCDGQVFGFHIHAGKSCTGNTQDPFADAQGHYNANDCEHPYHAGDLPPLFGNRGYAFSIVLTDRLTLEEIVGRTVVIHRRPDDFTSQPSGNSGEKIACGVIERR